MKCVILIIGLTCNLFAFSNATINITEPAIENASPDSVQFAEFVEKMPEFPGGNHMMEQWIITNIELPDFITPTSGTMYVRFIIDKSGDISNIRLLKGINASQDSATMALISKMPKWTPGSKNGEAIKIQYDLPIRFVNK